MAQNAGPGARVYTPHREGGSSLGGLPAAACVPKEAPERGKNSRRLHGLEPSTVSSIGRKYTKILKYSGNKQNSDDGDD